MDGLKTIGFSVGLAWMLLPPPSAAQLFVGGPNGDFTEFECDTTSFCNFDEDPISGDISSGGDVWIERDLEVGERIYARSIRSRAQDNSGRLLDLRSVASMAFTIDFDNNSGSGDQFEWFHNDSVNFTQQLAELESSGDFEIAGNFSSGVGSFDLAEAFLAGQELQEGEVVQVDPTRANRVLRASGSGVALGVVSSSPGIKLGAAVFAVDDLEAWGSDVKQEFLAREVALTREAIGRNPKLALVEHELAEAEAAPAPEAAQAGDGGPRPDRAQELAGRLREAALDLFVERSLVQVALAGRVPVKIDTESGPIRSGDYLTASPRPGLARKATAPGPVIGVALEDLKPGKGTVLMFVRNGWYDGGATTLALVEDLRRLVLEQQAIIEAKDHQLALLESRRDERLAALEEQLRRLLTERAEGRMDVVASWLPAEVQPSEVQPSEVPAE